MLAASGGAGPAANRLHTLEPSAGAREDFGDLVEHADALSFQLTLLHDAVVAEDARLASEQLAVAQDQLDDIDKAARALDAPECDSTA